MNNRVGQLLWRSAALVTLVIVNWSAVAQTGVNPQPNYDTVILNGRVVDPDSGFDAVRNVGIRDGKIAAITTDAIQGKAAINAAGLVVAPGFIDLHEHGQEPINYEFQAHDGVTTSLELEHGTDDVPHWYQQREGKALINYGVSIGHIPVRMKVMRDPGRISPTGDAAYRAATAEELVQIQQMIESGLLQGALGVGMGLNYTAGASHSEVLQIFRMAAKYHAIVQVHLRFLGTKEPDTGLAALEEVIAAAVTTGAPLHVAHITSMGLRETPELIAMVNSAQKRGLDVTTECYPYVAANTSIENAIFDPGWQERLAITYHDLQWVKTGERLTAETFDQYRKEGGQVVIYAIPEADVRAAVASPIVMIASDGPRFTGPKVHPRGAGTFSRVLGRYVRDEQALDLMTALRKMTIMPARRLEERAPEFKHKGRLQAGSDADLTLFDPLRVNDRATFEEPMRYSEGIQFVLVNGVAVISEGNLVPGVFPGRGMRAPTGAQ
jgi:N-acyl-D-aspartate/D-glutamate deacylase